MKSRITILRIFVVTLLLCNPLPLSNSNSVLASNLEDPDVGPSCLPTQSLPFTQPSVAVGDVDAVLMDSSQDQPANNRFRVRTAFNIPDADASLATWNVGQFTGFTPSGDVSVFQRAKVNIYPWSAMQVQNGTVGMWLNSLDLGSSSTPGHTVTGIGCWWWSNPIQIYPTNNRQLGVTFDMQVPYASKIASGTPNQVAEGYVGLNMLFRYGNNPYLEFWFNVTPFDLRSSISNFSVVKPDESTPNGPWIIYTSIDANNGWFYKTPSSNSFSYTQFSGFRRYDVRISSSEFAQAILALKQANPARYGSLTTNTADYKLTHFNLGPEILDTDGNGWAQVGASIQNLVIDLYPANNTMFFGGANLTGSGAMQVFFKTDKENFYSEDKSVWTNFPQGGGWVDFSVDMSANSKWQGRITGIRIDPSSASGNFGVDYIKVGTASGQYVQVWDFMGANPLSGWSFANINNVWTNPAGCTNCNGTRIGIWGGTAINNDPYFFTDTSIRTGR